MERRLDSKGRVSLTGFASPGDTVEVAVVEVISEEDGFAKVRVDQNNSGTRQVGGKGRVSLREFADPGEEVELAVLEVKDRGEE